MLELEWNIHLHGENEINKMWTIYIYRLQGHTYENINMDEICIWSRSYCYLNCQGFRVQFRGVIFVTLIQFVYKSAQSQILFRASCTIVSSLKITRHRLTQKMRKLQHTHILILNFLSISKNWRHLKGQIYTVTI